MMIPKQQHEMLRRASAELSLRPGKLRDELRRDGQLDSEYRITMFGRFMLARCNAHARAMARIDR